MNISDNISDRKIYTISQLTQNIKTILEDNFSLIWVAGEISNFRVPMSGHFYFTLKDSAAQINAVMFKGQNRNLKFMPHDGLNITGLGRISVYEPRGAYQIILEYLEPSGIGALQAAFEQLKAKLTEEGLFDDVHKKPIPFLPDTICLITSPTGSVVHDMIRIVQRRYKDVDIELIPVKVQGDDAVDEIVAGIELLNQTNTADISILARGGGSLEDLAPFNSEQVARAIFASNIPVISAIGHETDYTISDFVADLRAPTPSAAAELVVPVKSELKNWHMMMSRRLYNRFQIYINQHAIYLEKLLKRLTHPRKKIDDAKLRLDDYSSRLIKQFNRYIMSKHEKLAWINQRLSTSTPLSIIKDYRNLINHHKALLETLFTSIFVKNLSNYRQLHAHLHALSPTAILMRGYSISRLLPDKTIISDVDNVSIGQLIEILLAKGTLFCRVERKDPNGKINI